MRIEAISEFRRTEFAEITLRAATEAEWNFEFAVMDELGPTQGCVAEFTSNDETRSKRRIIATEKKLDGKIVILRDKEAPNYSV